ncbi:hypothetical protein Tco_1235525 [Tanacetum coccineum]
MCTKMVLEEEDRVERFIEGLPDNIQGMCKLYYEGQCTAKCRPGVKDWTCWPGLQIDDILIYSKTKEEHDAHLRLILEFLKKEEHDETFGCRRRSVDAEGESHSLMHSLQLKIYEKELHDTASEESVADGICGVRISRCETFLIRHRIERSMVSDTSTVSVSYPPGKGEQVEESKEEYYGIDDWVALSKIHGNRDVKVGCGRLCRKEDVEMTDADQSGADQHNVSQESGFEQEEEDAHVTLTVVHDTQKTEGPMQSSSVLSDFTEKLLNF